MKKILVFSLLLVACIAYGAESHNNISRLTKGVAVVGGTSDTTGLTLINSDSTTGEFEVDQQTLTYSTAGYSQTITFSPAFTATPTMIMGGVDTASKTAYCWGNGGSSLYGYSDTSCVLTYSAAVFSRPTTATGTAVSRPILFYGPVRTGVYQ